MPNRKYENHANDGFAQLIYNKEKMFSIIYCVVSLQSLMSISPVSGNCDKR